MEKKLIVVATGTSAGAEPSGALVEIRSPDGVVTEHQLLPGSYDIGRRAADIILGEDERVSELHARLEVSNRDVVLVDLGSHHGVQDARGQRLKRPLSLVVGEPVHIGSHLLTLRRPASMATSGAMRAARPTDPSMAAVSSSRPSATLPKAEASSTSVTSPEIPMARRENPPSEGDE